MPELVVQLLPIAEATVTSSPGAAMSTYVELDEKAVTWPLRPVAPTVSTWGSAAG